MKTLRGGNGLGDAFYVQAIARHLKRKGEDIRVATSWPDVFEHLNVPTIPFRRGNIDIVAHYINRKQIKATTQFRDCCIYARIQDKVEFKLDWPRGKGIKSDKPVIVVSLPRLPMNRRDKFGIDLLPDCSVIQKAIDILRKHATIVQVGSGDPLHEYKHIDQDLSNKTTVEQLINVAADADGFLGYCSFIVPLAESLGKPLLTVWSNAGFRSENQFIRLVTPQKILELETSLHVPDDCSERRLCECVDQFLGQIKRRRKVQEQDGGDRW